MVNPVFRGVLSKRDVLQNVGDYVLVEVQQNA
jgi:hypothetical protein